MNRLLLFLVFFLAVSSSALCVPPRSSPLQNNSAEVVELRAQVRAAKEYNERFISIVVWTLSSVVATVLFVGAFGWLNNRSNHERDREALQREAKFLRESVDIVIQEKLGLVKADFEMRIDAKFPGLQEKLERSVQALIAKQASRVDALGREIYTLKVGSLRAEAGAAMLEKNYGWAMYKYSELIDEFVNAGTDFYEASEVMDAMSKLAATPGFALSSDDVSKAVTALKRLSSDHGPAARLVISRIEKCLE